MKIYLDFETRSKADLPRVGAHNYAADPSTEVTLIGWMREDDRDAFVCEPSFMEGLIDYLADPNIIYYAWNAQFERLIFNNVLTKKWGVPEIELKRWRCIQSMATNCNLPASLHDASYVMGRKGLSRAKLKGNSLIKLFSMPQANGKFADPQDYRMDWQKFIEYCARDVEAMKDISDALPDWDKKYYKETLLPEYQISEMVNDRGIKIDHQLCEGAVRLVNQVKDYEEQLLYEATQGECHKLSSPATTGWLYEQLPDTLKEIMRDDTTKSGISLRAHTKDRLLAHKDLPEHLRKVVKILAEGAGNSVRKFDNFLRRSSEGEHVARGSYAFCGTHTGRFTSYGIQLQNLPRNEIDIVDPKRFRDFYYAVSSGNFHKAKDVCLMEGSSITHNLKALLRYSIIARRGKKFICADWSQIEGRMAPWLAMGIGGFTDSLIRNRLDAYSDPDRDIYCETATDILGRRIGKKDPERQSYGKTTELAFGYGGGVGALKTMATLFNVTVDNPEHVLKRWREANPWATVWHKTVMKAAINAVKHPGQVMQAGRVYFKYAPTVLGGSLQCRLPSGRIQYYPFCELKVGEHGEYLTCLRSREKPKANQKGWPALRLWHGILCENITQASAACLLRAALADIGQNYVIVGHTHDELLIEANDDAYFGRHVETIKRMMKTAPEWAQDLPLDVDVWTGWRFRK